MGKVKTGYRIVATTVTIVVVFSLTANWDEEERVYPSSNKRGNSLLIFCDLEDKVLLIL